MANNLENVPSNTIPLKGQLKSEFYGPALADYMVKNTNELVNKTSYNFLHKIVWVMSERCWYYLWNVDTQPFTIDNWRKVTSSASIPAYSDYVNYFVGEAVYFGFENVYKGETKIRYKIYSCIKNTEKGESPITNPEKWLCLSDDTLGIRMEFEEQEQFTIDTQDIINPVFQIYVKAELSQDPDIQNNENYIKVDPSIEFIESTGLYRITFYENDIPSKKTGFLYIK